MEKFAQVEFVDIEEKEEYKKLIEKVVDTCFKEENLIYTNLYLNVILTNPENIRIANKEYRNIDRCIIFSYVSKAGNRRAN